MMLAEIGLPPGADVDRQELDEATNISRFDILPDRVVLYINSEARTVHLTFTFRPRYGIKARSAPSTLYDYYNPDAQVFSPPSRFHHRER